MSPWRAFKSRNYGNHYELSIYSLKQHKSLNPLGAVNDPSSFLWVLLTAKGQAGSEKSSIQDLRPKKYNMYSQHLIRKSKHVRIARLRWARMRHVSGASSWRQFPTSQLGRSFQLVSQLGRSWKEGNCSKYTLNVNIGREPLQVKQWPRNAKRPLLTTTEKPFPCTRSACTIKRGNCFVKPWGHFCFIEMELVEGLLDLFK